MLGALFVVVTIFLPKGLVGSVPIFKGTSFALPGMKRKPEPAE